MPYQTRPPGRFAPTSLPGTMPGVRPPRADKPAMPAAPAASAPRPARNPFLDRLSPRTFDVPPEKVFAQLWGEEMSVDPVTGVCNNLRPKGLRPAPPPPAPAQGIDAVFARLFPRQQGRG